MALPSVLSWPHFVYILREDFVKGRLHVLQRSAPKGNSALLQVLALLKYILLLRKQHFLKEGRKLGLEKYHSVLFKKNWI